MRQQGCLSHCEPTRTSPCPERCSHQGYQLEETNSKWVGMSAGSSGKRALRWSQTRPDSAEELSLVTEHSVGVPGLVTSAQHESPLMGILCSRVPCWIVWTSSPHCCLRPSSLEWVSQALRWSEKALCSSCKEQRGETRFHCYFQSIIFFL